MPVWYKQVMNDMAKRLMFLGGTQLLMLDITPSQVFTIVVLLKQVSWKSARISHNTFFFLLFCELK